MCKYDNKYAYCLEASKKSPSAGKYPAQVIENNEAVRKNSFIMDLEDQL